MVLINHTLSRSPNICWGKNLKILNIPYVMFDFKNKSGEQKYTWNTL